MDSQNPAGSALLQDNSFGGNGDAADGNCVKTGLVKGWMDHANTCIKRCSKWSALYPPVSVGSYYRFSNYTEFAHGIETGPHGTVHNQLGGDCGQFSYASSANEPIFFLHHSMVSLFIIS
jgi:Common central domain of tyrosinase